MFIEREQRVFHTPTLIPAEHDKVANLTFFASTTKMAKQTRVKIHIVFIFAYQKPVFLKINGRKITKSPENSEETHSE